jgi:hypothetical protein
MPAAHELHERTRQAHRKSVESSPCDMAAYLQEALGQKLVAYTVGVGDPKTIGRWAANERAPRSENEERLRATFYIFRLLSEVESSHTIRAWFAGLNPLLGEEAPATAVREGRLREAVAAAKAFISEG